MKKLFAEFKEFISKGNVLDMAIGVIIATAFGSITTVLVNNVLMPLIGLIFGGQDFTNVLNITVRPEISQTAADGTVTVIQQGCVIALGDFVGAIINFIVIALICFIIVKSFNKARELAESKKKAEEAAEEAAPAAPTTEELLAEIRDLLKAQSDK